MDPVTIAMAVTALADISQTLLQYSNGTITQEQAHQQLLSAFDNVKTAIDQFEKS